MTTLPIEIAVLEVYFADCWELFWAVSGHYDEIRGHCPIAYFGDLGAFWDSSPRVLTVGLNPSHREFGDSKGERFPDSVSADRRLTDDRAWLTSVYAQDLNSYFHADRNPYKGWFDPAFRALLSGIGASFYQDNSRSTIRALHSDLFSPIATEPTWSGLWLRNRALRAKLVEAGVGLWQRLVEILQPDIIVASMQRDNVNELGLKATGVATVLTSVQERKGRTCAAVQAFELDTGKQGLLLTGGAGRKPMNGFSPEDRIKIGEDVLARWLRLTA